jgi:hypothetical protein
MKTPFSTLWVLCLLRLAESFNSHYVVLPARINTAVEINYRRSFKQLDQKHDKSNESFLFVSTKDEISDSPVLRSIDSKMENISKLKEKYKEMLDKYQSELDVLQNQKQEYLEGIKLGIVKRNFSESPLRSAVKAILWRIIAGGITFMTSLKFSGDITTALKIVGSDFFSKVATMFIGERLMN